MSKGTPRCRLVLQMVALAGSSFILVSSTLCRIHNNLTDSQEWMNSGYSFLTPVITKYFMQETISPFWSQSLYSLTLCASIIGLAGLVDRHGGNWVFLAALAWMSIWSLIAGLTTSYVLFCSSRAMQGLAGAAIIPAQTHIIGQLPISKHARPFALAICAALTPLGFLAGVCVASLSPEKVTWRLYFWIASGLSFILLSLHYLSDTQSLQMRTRTTSRKAWLSTALIATGSLCLSYSFALIPYQKASNPRIILPMIIGSFALLLVIWLETRGRGYALIPHSIYKTHENRLFLVMFVCFHASLGIVVFLYPL